MPPQTHAAASAHNTLTAAGTLDPERSLTELRLADGQVLLVPTATLLQAIEKRSLANDLTPANPQDGFITVPVLEERLTIDRRQIVTDTVRLHKTVEPFEQAIDELLLSRSYTVERVACDRVVDERPAVRQQGDTTIFPVVEEQIVVTRQLKLREELHVTLHESERRDTSSYTLQREHVEVEHVTPHSAE